MNPRDIDPFKKTHLPFIGTFEKSECEFAALIIVLAMAERDNCWSAVSVGDCVNMVDSQEPDSHLARLAQNPFLIPDAYGLVDRGYADWEYGIKGGEIKFTRKGIAAMKPFSRKVAS